ncbi:MAG TPA: hypothetical protein VK489_00645 [Ferruginibacter sp.]|nr:hypothetical protein [Ferruginibacter sp.]
MRQILHLAILMMILASCKTSKNYLSRQDDDKTLFDVVKALNKRSSDTAAVNALPVLYTLAQQRHLKKINGYSVSKEITRWDKVISEYKILQEMHDVITDADVASRIITPVNYQPTLYDIKQQAAAEYYEQASIAFERPGRENAKRAYNYFKKTDVLVADYKDAKQKMDEAYQNAIVNVQVNPVIDNSFFFNTGWGNYGYNYSNEYFQQTLVRELGGKNSSRYAAKFYTEWEARRDNIQPDMVVDLILKNIQIHPNSPYRYTRNASRQVEKGRDTSGKVIYETVYATVHITRQTYSGFAEMGIDITDVNAKRNLSSNTFREHYSRQEEHGSYNGDSRALSSNDWTIVNNSNFHEPSKEEILNDLYRKIYPQVKNRIIYAVDW